MSSEHKCEVCGQSRHVLAYCCKSCMRLLRRVDTRGGVKTNKKARLDALHNAWDGKYFRCHYTGWPLNIDNHRDPHYLTWEHRTPRDEDDIVAAAAIINDMKSDLTDREFRRLVIGLAKRFEGSRSPLRKIKPKFYKR